MANLSFESRADAARFRERLAEADAETLSDLDFEGLLLTPEDVAEADELFVTASAPKSSGDGVVVPAQPRLSPRELRGPLISARSEAARKAWATRRAAH